MPNKIKCIRYENDLDEDELYFPTESPYCYLDEELLKELCKKVHNKYPNSSEVITCIVKIEKIHARSVNEGMNTEYENSLISKVQDEYRNKNKIWPHHEKAYKEFYSLLNGEDVF